MPLIGAADGKKEAAADGRISYAILDEHADRIAATLQRSEKA